MCNEEVVSAKQFMSMMICQWADVIKSVLRATVTFEWRDWVGCLATALVLPASFVHHVPCHPVTSTVRRAVHTYAQCGGAGGSCKGADCKDAAWPDVACLSYAVCTRVSQYHWCAHSSARPSAAGWQTGTT